MKDRNKFKKFEALAMIVSILAIQIVSSLSTANADDNAYIMPNGTVYVGTQFRNANNTTTISGEYLIGTDLCSKIGRTNDCTLNFMGVWNNNDSATYSLLRSGSGEPIYPKYLNFYMNANHFPTNATIHARIDISIASLPTIMQDCGTMFFRLDAKNNDGWQTLYQTSEFTTKTNSWGGLDYSMTIDYKLPVGQYTDWRLLAQVNSNGSAVPIICNSSESDIATMNITYEGVELEQLNLEREQKNLMENILDFLRSMLDEIKDAITGIGDTIMGGLQSLGDSIMGALSDLGDMIINGLKNLFIPSDNYFGNWMDELQVFFDGRFGFLVAPFELLIQIINVFINAPHSTCSITLPYYEFMGYPLIPEYTYVISSNPICQQLVPYIRMLFNVLISFGFIRLLSNKYREVFKNGN